MIIQCDICKFEGDAEDFFIRHETYTIPNNMGTAVETWIDCPECERKYLISTLRM